MFFLTNTTNANTFFFILLGGPKKIFSGSFKTNRTYVKEMADKNSQPYRNEADIIKIMVCT